MFSLSKDTFGLSKDTFGLSKDTFGLNKKYIISNEVSNYIKDTTNKSLEKYKNKTSFINPNTLTILTTNSNNNKVYPSTCFTVLPFVSLMAFLAGYKLGKLIN